MRALLLMIDDWCTVDRGFRASIQFIHKSYIIVAEVTKGIHDMEMTLYIDNREGALIEALANVHQPRHVEVKQLDMGDILLTTSTVGDWVFERKTMADLAASIKDGRYREQKARLLAHFPTHRITYMIEGAPCVSKWCDDKAAMLTGRVNAGILQGFVFNTMYRDGIHVVFMQDLEDTAAFISAFAEKVQNNASVFAGGATGVAACTQESAMMIKSRPGANVTPDLCWRLMLAQIPGISEKLSSEIVKVWPTMLYFVHDLDALDEKARLMKLKAVPLLGPKKAAVICAYIFVKLKHSQFAGPSIGIHT